VYRFDPNSKGWRGLPPFPEFFISSVAVTKGGALALWPDERTDSYYLLGESAESWRRIRKPADGNWRFEVTGSRLLVAPDSMPRGVFVIEPFAWARQRG
jgi:hypothetical protein